MKPRKVYEVRWYEGLKKWVVRHDGRILEKLKTKQLAIFYGAGIPRDRWNYFKELGQLRIFNKDGRMCAERTYGEDPARRPG